jgi:uncharacterized damage-inducible protein DinB
MHLSRKLQEIVDRITIERQQLLDSVNGLSESQLNYKSEGSTWSITDILHHLALTDEANAKFTSRIVKQVATLPPDATPDSSVAHSMDEIFERTAPEKFQAPPFVSPQEHAPAEQSIGRLKASRELMLKNLSQLSAYELSSITYPHPFAGDLNAYQWFLIAGGHEARHTDQIKRIKVDPGFPR